MSLPKWREDWVRNAGVVGVIAVGLVVVGLTVFMYLVALSRSHAAAPPDPERSVEATPWPVTASGTATVAMLPSPVAADAPERYSDPRYAFELAVPAGWRRATVADEDRPALAADYDVVWAHPETGARIAVSAWNARAVTSFLVWSALLGAGMQSVDGQAPTNAMVAGRPALLLWAPETPTTPARLALFLARDDTYYRVAYTAHDGGAAIVDYARALATLRWPGDSPASALLPLRGLPDSRFWPDERLYGR